LLDAPAQIPATAQFRKRKQAMSASPPPIESQQPPCRPQGGMTRLRYFLYLLAFGFGVLCLQALVSEGALWLNRHNHLPPFGPYAVNIVLFMISLGSVVIELRLSYLRIRDIGYSGWYCLLVCVLPSVVSPLVMFTPTNYRQTREKDGWMVLGLLLYALGLVLTVVMVVGLAFIFLGRPFLFGRPSLLGSPTP
jgi:uncharacterized membrane protein YhaH (DUF805 family)